MSDELAARSKESCGEGVGFIYVAERRFWYVCVG